MIPVAGWLEMVRMAPGSRRPAGDDEANQYRSVCECGYDRPVYAYQRKCPQTRDHVPDRTCAFVCTPTGR
jgi:hypothetical protein